MVKRRPRTIVFVLAAAAALLAAGAFFVDTAGHALNDTGPEVYSWSAYERYYDHAGLWLVVYLIVPAALVLLAGMVRAKPLRWVLGAAAAGAIFAPLIVPHHLDQQIRGDDPALLSERYTSTPVTGGVSVCLKYAVDTGKPPPSAPRLCVLVAGPGADAILRDTGVEQEIADDLNSQGITPRELPESIDVEGLRLVRAIWN